MSNPDNKKLDNVPLPTADAPRLDDGPFWQALQNSLIMDIIFSFLSIIDLKNFRLTNNAFSQVGAMALFKKASRLGSVQMEHLKELTDIIRTSRVFPCSKFCFRTGQTKNLEEDATLKDFFKTVSPFITELGIEKRTGHIFFCKKSNIEIEYPSLRTLRITHKCLAKQDIEDWTKDVAFLQNIITHSPLLDTVAIKSFNYNAEFISKFLNALDNPQGRNIKHLELRGIVASRQLELATSLGFSLNTLKLEFLNLPDVSPNSISSFLASQTDTLQELEIGSFPAQKSNTGVIFPRMNSLKVLKLRCRFSLGITFSNILYAQQFPTLNQLTLDVHYRFFYEFGSRQPRCDTVTTLALPTMANMCCVEIIQSADRLFPNLKKLRVPARNEVCYQLNNCMRNLEELTFTKGNQEDCLGALTGYRSKELNMIEKHLEDHEELVYEERRSEPQGFLHNIKVLKIEQELERDFDLVYHLGFKKLRSLERLDLRRGESSINPNKVNEQTLVKMREQFEVLILETDIIRGKQPKQWKRERSVHRLPYIPD